MNSHYTHWVNAPSPPVIVDTVDEFRIFEDAVNNLPRITIPELVLGGHPFRRWCVFQAETVILGGI